MTIPKYIINQLFIENDEVRAVPISKEQFAANEGLVSVEPATWFVDYDGIECGNCGTFFYKDEDGDVEEYHYCPECGARMENIIDRFVGIEEHDDL